MRFSYQILPLRDHAYPVFLFWPIEILFGNIHTVCILLIMLCLNFIVGVAMAAIALASIPSQAVPIYSSNEIVVITPELQLGPGSLEIHHKQNHFFCDWTEDDHIESFNVLKKIVRCWSSKGIHNYFVLGRIGLEKEFYWEVIPYYSEESSMWQQIKTTYHVFFGGSQFPQTSTLDLDNAPDASEILRLTQPTKADPFCQDSVIQSQQIASEALSSEKTHVLYNYKPHLEDHLLVVSKEHYNDFSDLPLSVYLEAMDNLKIFCNAFSRNDQGYERIWVYHTTGEPAGQTVLHWHMHFIVEPKGKSNVEKAGRVLSRICFQCLPPISQSEIDQKVHYYQTILAEGTIK